MLADGGGRSATRGGGVLLLCLELHASLSENGGYVSRCEQMETEWKQELLWIVPVKQAVSQACLLFALFFSPLDITESPTGEKTRCEKRM